MALQTGTKLGSYDIIEPIGKGGMGEVYRARDAKLGRDVAIKVLPDELSQDAERLQRFEREARLLAQLNHANVATLYGFEDGYLVMELVEGETLADRLERGPMPIDEAVSLFIEIAQGLEAAHAKDIIHRDLKPANIKIDPDGKPKILDFGLAKAFAPETDVSAETSQSPTMTKGTALGAIMGTASYMSPEQAKGKLVDKRTDIWAFGCCLYEALAGKKAFDGETATDAIAAVVKTEPDWSALPSGVSSRARVLIERCLRKDARRRVHDIADVRLELEESTAEDEALVPLPTTSKSSVTAGVGIAGFLAGLAVAVLLRPSEDAGSPSSTLRLTINAEPYLDQLISPTISPDGARVVYTGVQGETRRLFLRELDAPTAQPIPVTEGAEVSFFSPDGQWIGYFATNELRRVSVLGGDSFTVCQTPSQGPGAAWVRDDTIVFSPSWSSGLSRVRASGGEPEPLTTLDRDAGEGGHWWPDVLPDGRTILFTVFTKGTLNDAAIHAVDLETGERRPVMDGARARYAESGHLVFYHGGRYQAVSFDTSNLEPTSEPVTVLDGTRKEAPLGASHLPFAFSRNGTLVSIPGDEIMLRKSGLVWIHRSGDREPIPYAEAAFKDVRVSPTGDKIAAVKGLSGSYDIWIYDVARGTDERLTREPANFSPVWHPGGDELAFASTRTGTFDVYRKKLGASAPVVPVTESPQDLVPFAWSHDGSFLVVTEQTASTSIDVARVDVTDPSEPRPLVQTPFGDLMPHLSRDSNWVAFASDESGRHEIYVTSTSGNGERVRVSTDGGIQPLWSPTRDELFYRNRDVATMVAYRVRDGRFEADAPSPLFTLPPDPNPFFDDQVSWDIAPDGERFLVLEVSPDAAPRDEIHVTTNWFQELNALLPANP